MGAAEMSTFLTWLAVERHVSAATQNQALSALLFLYKGVLGIDVGRLDEVPRARLPIRVPVVLSRDEVSRVLKQLTGKIWIIVVILYGAGLRIQDCLGLRVKDIDFDRHQIVVRRGKGQKDVRTMLPVAVRDRLRAHLEEVKRQHERDLARGVGRAVLPFALDRKYPNASTDWAWQFVFPAARICRDPQWGPPSRFHLHESVVQKEVTEAVRRAGLTKRVGPHVMRHSFATHLLEDGYDIRTVQELLGDRDVRTTMIYVVVAVMWRRARRSLILGEQSVCQGHIRRRRRMGGFPSKGVRPCLKHCSPARSRWRVSMRVPSQNNDVSSSAI
jgi:integron integrase